MNTADTIRAQSRRDPEQLEREIDRQRDHIGDILHALEGRLSPGDLVNELLGGKGGNGELASTLAQSVRANPMPALLTAAGVIWLVSSQRQQRTSTTTVSSTTLTSTDADTDDKPGRMDSAKQHLGNAKTKVGEKAHGAMDSARHGARRANAGFHDMLDEHPMAVGAMAIAAGAMIGALLPSTRTEDEWMGRSRDKVADKARDAARSGLDRVSEAGRDVTTPGHRSGPGHERTTSSEPGMGRAH